jgi:hypothetical protein
MLVQRDWPPSENGAMPLALNFGHQGHDVGPGLAGLHADLVEDLLVVEQTIGCTVSIGIA